MTVIKETVRIPNKEVSQEYVNAISTMDWKEVISSIKAFKKIIRGFMEYRLQIK